MGRLARLFAWCLLVVATGFPLGASPTLPEEASAPSRTSEAPAVRYWKSEPTSPVPWTLNPLSTANLVVPKRSDPKVVPVMYHNIVFGRTGNIYNRDIYNFEHDLEFLRRNYEIIDFSDLIAIKEQRRSLSTDATILTFDDGDLSIYAIVYPLLKELGVRATFFIVPNFIGEVGYMSWDQLREMSRYRDDAGVQLFSFGSHSLTHRALGDLDWEEVLYEMKESKRILEEQLQEAVLTIALPFGSGAGMRMIREAAVASGYRAVRTSSPGPVHVGAIDLMHIKAFNVENYSTDVFVQHMLRLSGR